MSRRSRRRPAQAPESSRASVRDLAFLLALTAIALLGFSPTFTGYGFAVVAGLGLLIGVGLTVLARRRGWPAVAPILLGVVVFVLLGGPLCLRQYGASAYLPGPHTLTTLADQVVFGWKDLLTTLPPVDGTGKLLVLPWLLGLVGGLAGGLLLGVAGRRRPGSAAATALPLVAPLLVLCGVILLGVRHPASLLLQGAVFAGLAILWAALRGLGLSNVATTRAGRARRSVGGLALLTLAVAVAVPVGTRISGTDDDRVVVRDHVAPPFDIGQYPSPLAGFRRYTKQARPSTVNVHAEELFSIKGVPAGTRVRFAALDDYDGTVWGAAEDTVPGTSSDTFQRVSTVIDNPVRGRRYDATVTVADGYSGVWLPTVGALQAMRFEHAGAGHDTEAQQETFRYNLATSTAVVPAGVGSGDRYRFTGVVAPDDEVHKGLVVASGMTTAGNAAAFLETPAQNWGGADADPLERVLAIAHHLKTQGYYSDGDAENERMYHAGHSVKRLLDEFVNGPLPLVGNDEQYAAIMALLANRVGVPARVVLGAIVPAGGEVKGADVHAWVELMGADGRWRTLPTDAFMGKQTPAEQPPQTEQEMSGTVVPPPAPIPPPSNAGEQTDSELKSRRTGDEGEGPGFGIPVWLRVALVAVGAPLALFLLFAGLVLGLKLWRRRRRRHAGRPSARIVGAWREYVDAARDLGQDVPVRQGATRREQAGHVGTPVAHELARHGDAHVFGPTPPDDAAVEDYWRLTGEERRAMRRAVGRRQRLRAALSLRTFRRRWAKEPTVVLPRESAGVPASRNNDAAQGVRPR